MKSRKRTEGAAADRVKDGDSSSVRVDSGPTCLTSFGMIAKPLLKTAEKRISDALVTNGAEAPKPHLPSVEVRMLSSATGGFITTGTTSTMMRSIFPRSLSS